MASAKNFVCSCFYTHNYFLEKYNVHVVYEGEDQLFWSHYEQELLRCGMGPEEKSAILDILHKENERRRYLAADSTTRQRVIRENYKPLHPHVYNLDRNFLDEGFLELVSFCKQATSAGEVLGFFEEKHPEWPLVGAERVYAFPVFRTEFCRDFLEEVENFERSDAPKGRPNTMNNYGVLLNELGFNERLFDPLCYEYIQPISSLLFPDWGGDALDSYKPFIVKYAVDEDLSLAYHYDNAEVTINVSLGKQFEGGQLYFGAMRTEPLAESYAKYSHLPGIGLLHRGQQRHGAEPLSSGRRYNLIVWMRSSRVRNKLCPMCNRLPSLVKTEGAGDGFKEEQKEMQVCTTA